jgi:hypothetical protein
MEISKVVNLYDNTLTSNFFYQYLTLYNNIQLSDRSKFIKLINNFYEYNLIDNNNYSAHTNMNIMKTKYKLFSIKDLFNFKNESILQYHNYTPYFFQYYEIIKEFKLIKEDTRILEMSNKPVVFEACYYYQKKKYDKQSSYTLDYFTNYVSKKDKKNDKDYLKLYNQYYKIDINTITNMDINSKDRYDLIFANIYYIDLDIKGLILYQLTDYINYDLYIVQLYYALNRLELNGNIVFPVLQIRTKAMADLVLLIASYFEEYHLYMPECQNKYKWSSVWVIYKKLQTNKFNKLKEAVDYIYINNKDIVRKTFDQKLLDTISAKIDNSYIASNMYIVGLLPNKLNDPIYDKIIKFNEYIYFMKTNHLQYIYNYTQMSSERQEKTLKKQRRLQIITGLLYAKKWRFTTVDIDDKNNNTETLILTDMFSLYKPIVFEFSYHKPNDTIDIPKDFNKQNSKIEMADYTIDTRNINEWNKIKHIVRYYRPFDNDKHLRTIIEKKFNQQNISQAWIKMYEMITHFNLINNNDNFNTFHMCEAPGNFISAINHYIKTKTNIKKYDWYAQTLNPTMSDSRGFKDDFNYIENYSDRWIFGEDNTGDIMKTINIKYYRKYTLDRNISLLTSDCGIPEKFGRDDITKLHIAQLIFILYNLPQGGNFVAKMKFPITYPLQFNLYYKFYKNFNKLYFFKGHQNPSSKEFYFIGINYNRDNFKNELETIIDILDNYDDNINKQVKLPENFIYQLLKIHTVLINNYLFNFKRKLFYVDNYKYIKKEKFDLLDSMIDEKNKEWLESQNITRIKDSDLL